MCVFEVVLALYSFSDIVESVVFCLCNITLIEPLGNHQCDRPGINLSGINRGDENCGERINYA